jgi:hypothetical protein
MQAVVGSRPQTWGNKYMRKFLIALSIATVTVAMTAVSAFATTAAGGIGPCCYS